MWWFWLGALGLSLVIAFIGWKLPPKRKPAEPEHLWSREYQRMYEDAIRYAEQLYQQKK